MPGGTYRLYGLSVRSPVVLPCPRDGRAADVTIRRRGTWADSRIEGRPALRDWFWYRQLADGSAFVRWRELSEFVVSRDGTEIQWRRLPRLTDQTFRGYLLSQVLSFSLLARGVEPLHGSAVAVDGRVIGFLGDCGLGKSTLTAAMVHAGYPLVTDDLLVLSHRTGRVWVEPGVPSIKLDPRLGRRLLGVRRVGPRVAPGATKAILSVPPASSVQEPLPLHALYVLSRGRTVRISPCQPAAVLLEIVGHAFNTVRVDEERLASQFRFARRLAATVRMRRLAYPRRLAGLPGVVDAVLRDLRVRP